MRAPGRATSSNREMFQGLGTPASDSMPMSRRKPSLRRSSPSDGLGGDVPQGDPQDDDAPEDMDRVVVAALAAGPAERVEELGIGQGREQILDGLQRGAVFERFPIEERLGRVEDHHGRGPWDFRGEIER